MRHKISTLISALLAGGCLCASAQQLAFPGAQGWGRFATGARNGGTVYHVTNLNDSGSGSLRDAISQPNRIIVFDVAGVININSRLVFSENLYVAGQTAPGEGIIVYGDGVSFSGANNIIVRHVSFRMGKNGTSGKDCAGIANGANMIFDHCSFSWGLDEVFSINPDGKGTTPQYITISNCIMGQGLLSHSAGGLMQSDSITLYRNFYCDNSTRNNKVKGALQYVNNIVYNWSSGCFLMGGDSSGSSYVNATNNLFINGPSGDGNAFTSGNADFHIYAEDNWQDRDCDGTFNPYEIPHDEYTGGPTFMDTPYNYPQLDTWEAKELPEKLLPEVGASLPYRDLADFYMVHECLSFGTDGMLISSEEQLSIGTPSSWTIVSFDKPTDTDGDGMPDEWETANGTDPAVDDAMTIAANGYANIENYINNISKETVPTYLREPQLVEATATTSSSITIGWADYTEGEEGFIVEMEEDGEWKEIARTEAGAEEYLVDSLEAGTRYSFRIRAYKGEEYSEYATLTATTKQEPVEMVDCETFVGDDDNWLIDPTEDEVITLTESVSKTATVVRSNANVTITGEGSLDGGSLNKTWTGTLTVETTNNYTGQTVIHDGVFAFNSLKDGGEPSAIGASIEDAQNWIWDGGTWSYTGASTSTNRSATLYKDTEFNIASSASVDMTGALEGEGNLTISGNGTLKPSSPSFFQFDGDVTLKDGGSLNLPYLATLSSSNVYLGEEDSTRKLILAGGNFSVTGGNGKGLTYNIPIEVTEGTYSTFAINRNCSIKSTITGTGTLEYQIPYVREYVQGDWSQFYGTLVANGVGTESDGSQLMLHFSSSGQNAGMPNTKVKLTGNTRMISWNTNDELYIGGLSGDAGTNVGASSKNTSNAQMIWHIGSANSDEEFRGVIDNRCSASNYNAHTTIIKEGSGIWRLAGNNTYNGTTTVNGGSLIVNGTNSGTGAYTVNDGATLAGEGTVAGSVTLKEGATIQGGDTLVANGTGLTITSSLKLEDGAIVNIMADRAYANTITVSGAITIGENVTLQINDGIIEEAPYNATEYHVFTSDNLAITGTFAEILPATPGDGQTWDITDLYTEGILRVVGGEENPNPDEPDEPETPDNPEGLQTALLTWGNMSTESYDNSGINNMLVGNAGDDAEGFSLVLTGNLTKAYTSASKIDVVYNGETINRTTIKCSNGAQNSIFLPEGVQVTNITLWSYTNIDAPNRPNYWGEVAGVEYTEETATILTCYKDLSNPDHVSFDVDNVEDVLTFTNSGEQQCVIIALEYQYGGETTGISSVTTNEVPASVEYYSLSGRRVSVPGTGIYIMKATMPSGKVVTRKVIK